MKHLELYYDDQAGYYFIGDEEENPYIKFLFEGSFEDLSDETKIEICKSSFYKLNEKIQEVLDVVKPKDKK